MYDKKLNEMATTKKKGEDEIRVRGVSPKLVTELNNIANNIGISLTQMLKPKLREISDSYPEKMKEPLKDY